MSKHIALKSLALFISWLTLSPLLLILDGRWKLLSKRLRKLFFFFSPLMLIVYMAILIACYLFYCEHFRVRYFVKPKVVENITGVRLPNYKVIEYERGPRSFNGDYKDEFVLEFKNIPDESFYKELDEHFDCFEPGKYCYSTIWGNGIEAPKGVSDKNDGTFRVEIEKGSKTFYIEAGTW
jgi:hypothetical protein